MNKRNDLLAKYLADLSKIIFGTVIVKQFINNKFHLIEFIIGCLSALVFIILAYFTQPKE